jgi:hypothetical protein
MAAIISATCSSVMSENRWGNSVSCSWMALSSRGICWNSEINCRKADGNRPNAAKIRKVKKTRKTMSTLTMWGTPRRSSRSTRPSSR